MDERYNGWTNYETWNVALWIDNDGSDAYWRDRAQELFADVDTEDGINDRKSQAAYELGEEMRQHHEESMPEVTGTFADLLSAALRAVNWYEIAEHYTDDLEVPETEEDTE